jgi:hypothetical protein
LSRRFVEESRNNEVKGDAMTTWFKAGATAGVLLLAASICQASIQLSMSSAPANLGALQINNVINVSVSLFGLTPGEQIGALGADISFSQSLLGSPTVPTPGAIVPDSTGFFSSIIGSGSGETAVYDVLFSKSGTPITSNWVFYAFSVTAKAAGSDDISFSSVNASDDAGNTLAIAAGPDISYTIVPSTATVPEPGSWCVWVGIIVTSLVIFRLRRVAFTGSFLRSK